MKIALIGYGKMGHAIERIALERGHTIVQKIDIDNASTGFDTPEFRSADVAIEFTTPATALGNCLAAFEQGVPVVCGSTGWKEKMAQIHELCDKGKATFFWTSNFSIGVNLFFAVNRYLAALMEPFSQYRPEMTEIHHIHKLDHPSGTAITLAEGIIDECPRIKSWSETEKGDDIITINHKREGEVPGTHIINWDSTVDTITIEHKAKNRDGFALGAVMAAEWVKGRKGWLTMDEMLRSVIADPKP